MSTNAMPVSGGSSLRSWPKASSPPAEAPIPTIGNEVPRRAFAGPSTDGASGVTIPDTRLGDTRLRGDTRLGERAGADLLGGAFRPLDGFTVRTPPRLRSRLVRLAYSARPRRATASTA